MTTPKNSFYDRLIRVGGYIRKLNRVEHLRGTLDGRPEEEIYDLLYQHIGSEEANEFKEMVKEVKG